MGRTRKIGKPRGRNGGRKPILTDQQARKSRSLYCSDEELRMAKALIILMRADTMLDSYLSMRFFQLVKMSDSPPDLSYFERLRIYDLQAAAFYMKNVGTAFQKLLKLQNQSASKKDKSN